MKLEFLDDISEGGRYKGVVSERLIRLYDFDEVESGQLLQRLNRFNESNEKELDLSVLPFIKPLNCRLTLRLADNDSGVIQAEPGIFSCELTREGFKTMALYVAGISDGYNWLCDTSKEDIDLLYSSGGTW